MSKLTEEEAHERIAGVLRAYGIKVKIGGCGCCGSPFMEAEFPDGATADIDNFHLDTFDDLPPKAG